MSIKAKQVAGVTTLVVAIVAILSAYHLSTLSAFLLEETASRAGGWTTELGWGILNAEAAVRRALELAQDTIPPSTSRRGIRSRRAGRVFTLRWRGRDLAPPGIRPVVLMWWTAFRAVLRINGAEDVRMPAHELGVHVPGDVAERARAALLEQQRQEVDLEEDVAQLVEQLRVVAAVGRVG
mgnify:CR=1 FL=1